MDKNYFLQVYVALKAAGSKMVLSIGHGVIFVISLLMSIILGFLTYWLYQVPVKDVQIYVNKVYGGNEEEYSKITMNLDYGMDVTQKYKKDYKSGINVDIFSTEDWRKIDTGKAYVFPYHPNPWLGVKFSYHLNEIRTLLDRELQKKYGTAQIMDSIFALYAIHTVESKLPRTFFSGTADPDINIRNSLIVKTEGKYAKDSVFRKSVVYKESCENEDSITGLDSFSALCYAGLTESGDNEPINIPHTSLLTKPSIWSLFDISQSYFHFTIFAPMAKEGSEFTIDFGGAIDFSNIDPEPDIRTMSSIVYKDVEKLAKIRYNGLWMHATFKQTENMQILRMFILTTAFGFFVALMFSSACNGLRLACRRYRRKENSRAK